MNKIPSRVPVLVAALAVVGVSLLATGLSAAAQQNKPATSATTVIINPSNPTVTPGQITPLPVNSVTLTASASKSTYFSGEPVEINLTLTNKGTSAIGLSNLTETICVSNFTRDGNYVQTVEGYASYYDGFDSALQASLASVRANGTRSILWRSSYNASMGGEVLRVAEKARFDNIVTQWATWQPGVYTITFHYQYPTDTTKGAFAGTLYKSKTNSVTVTFTVV